VVELKEAVVTTPETPTFTGTPAFVPSIWNCTVPVGVPEPGAVTPTVAVKVTFWPHALELLEVRTAVLVPALLTVCVTAAEVLALKLLSVTKDAVTG
jgi:hypothetical protein